MRSQRKCKRRISARKLFKYNAHLRCSVVTVGHKLGRDQSKLATAFNKLRRENSIFIKLLSYGHYLFAHEAADFIFKRLLAFVKHIHYLFSLLCREHEYRLGV